jgi:hypothetical protein
MPKVKILAIAECVDYYDEYSRASICHGISDWEEVTEEELVLLRLHLRSIKQPPNRQLVLAEYDTEPVTFRIDNIRAMLEKMRKEQEERDRIAAAEKAKRDARKRERELKKLAKDEEEERAILLALQQKYGAAK